MKNKEPTCLAGSNRVLARPGDVLENLDTNDPWRYFICYLENGEAVVRCELHHNVGMDQLYEVRNLGHYSNNPGILSEQDLEEFKDQGI